MTTNNTINSEKFYQELEKILELDPNSIKGNEDLAEIHWDSMATISFIAMVDANYGVSIPVVRLSEAKTVADLYTLVAELSNPTK
jgi:acyl carrier protein